MEPIASATPITMTILSTIVSLPFAIYESSTITFSNDEQAYTIEDID